jgi:hypothetical protein
MTTMKTMIIGAAAALIATVSLASTADAGWKWKKHHHNHHWKHRHHHGFYIYGHRSYCFIKKVKHYDDWGNVYIKRIRVCPW